MTTDEFLNTPDAALATKPNKDTREHDERVRGEERQKMTATLAIVLGCDKWLGSGVVVHENVARAVAEHDAAIRDAACEVVRADIAKFLEDNGSTSEADAVRHVFKIRALKAVKT